jgi:hypothetical protein
LVVEDAGVVDEVSLVDATVDEVFTIGVVELEATTGVVLVDLTTLLVLLCASVEEVWPLP